MSGTGSTAEDAGLLARLDGQALAFTQRLAFIGVIGMLVIGVLTTVDVVLLRSLFNRPIPGSNEFLNTIFAVAIAAVLASGLAQRANIEIDMLATKLSPRSTAWLRAFGHALFLLVLVLITWRVAVHTHESQGRGQMTVILQWPMAPFLWTITALVAACLPVQLVVLLRAVESALQGGRPAPVPTTRTLTASAMVIIAVAVAAVAAWYGIEALRPAANGHGSLVSVALCLVLWVLILLFVPVGAALALCGITGTALLMGFSSAYSVLGSETVGLITNADLAVIPLFLMMGGFATASGMAADLYKLAHALFGWLRGGLAYATIGGCAAFGSIAGTSMGTVATMGAVALPEMRQRGYSAGLITGSITAGGTLGQLVPPGTAIVVYALLVEESIGRLYIAVLIPALLTALFYMATVGLMVRLQPSCAPGRGKFELAEVKAALKGATSAFVLIAAVIGGIFFGIFTATEAAAVGAVIAFLDALIRGRLGKGALWQVVGETTRSTAMIYFVIIGAMMIAFFIGTSGLPDDLMHSLTSAGLPKLAVIALLVLAYIVLGTAMDGFTLMIITAPLTAAMVVSLGYSPVWWGIMMVVLVELGEVTPPFGMNLFMMKSLAPDVTFPTIFRGVMPFVLADCVKVVLLVAFPALTLWLPSLMFK